MRPLLLSIALASCVAPSRPAPKGASHSLLREVHGFRAPTEAPPPREDGRLPGGVEPLRYALSLDVDPTRDGLTGRARIHVRVAEPQAHVVLHGRGLVVHTVRATRAQESRAARVAQRPAIAGRPADQLVLSFDAPLDAGEWDLALDYEAPYAPDLAGPYRVDEQGESYVFTQFESTYARRAFPCFDEPGFKVPFDLELIVPSGMRAFANTPETESKPAGTKTSIRFATTPPMPTYLVAFAVGHLDVLDGVRSPTPIRVIATRGKTAMGQTALDATSALLSELVRYFDMPYPYPKLDVVAVPNFAAGAMENPGLITFREELLLVDPARASTRARKYQASVIAHELAHQWFGDFVTMKWWDDLWLNEGFATWMEAKATHAWQPGMGSMLDDLQDTQHVMDTDALASARAVRQPARTVDEIDEAFDGITYQKGSAVLKMVERWIGPETFRAGVRQYVRKFAWGNAGGKDLLAILEAASHKNVSEMAAGFLDRPGVPLIEVDTKCDARGYTIGLKPNVWRPLGSTTAASAPSMVPVCLQVSGKAEPLCADVRAPMSLSGTGACPAWVFPNDGLTGYYRFLLPKAGFLALAKAHSSLSTAARIGLLANLWASVRAGGLGAEDLLGILPLFDQETNRHVVEEVIGILEAMSTSLIDDASRAPFRAYVAARLRGHVDRLGWGGTGKKEDEERTLLRRAVLHAMGSLAHDERTLREADAYAIRWLEDPTRVDANVAAIAVEMSTYRAGAERLDALRAAAKRAKTPEDRLVALLAITAFEDHALLERALDVALTDEYRVQDMRYAFRVPLSRVETRATAIGWMKTHWNGLRKKLPGSHGGRLLGAAGSVCTLEERDDLAQFLTPRAREIEGGARPLAEGLEAATLCASLRQSGAPGVHRWLAGSKR